MGLQHAPAVAPDPKPNVAADRARLESVDHLIGAKSGDAEAQQAEQERAQDQGRAPALGCAVTLSEMAQGDECHHARAERRDPSSRKSRRDTTGTKSHPDQPGDTIQHRGPLEGASQAGEGAELEQLRRVVGVDERADQQGTMRRTHQTVDLRDTDDLVSDADHDGRYRDEAHDPRKQVAVPLPRGEVVSDDEEGNGEGGLSNIGAGCRRIEAEGRQCRSGGHICEQGAPLRIEDLSRGRRKRNRLQERTDYEKK